MTTTAFSLAELSELFATIGGELGDGGDLNDVPARLSALAARQVPGADYAGITVGRAGQRFTTVAATAELVRRTDEIQYELGSGPCVDALIEDTTFNAPDLRTDERWPEFGRRAVEATGIVSMLSFRLYHERDRNLVSGLNMYSHRPRAFDEPSETIGLLLATHGALAVDRAQARKKADNLEIALKNSRDIGVAMGILMHAHKVTQEKAFDLLRIASQHTHRKLADIASEVALTGVFPAVPQNRG